MCMPGSAKSAILNPLYQTIVQGLKPTVCGATWQLVSASLCEKTKWVGCTSKKAGWLRRGVDGCLSQNGYRHFRISFFALENPGRKLCSTAHNENPQGSCILLPSRAIESFWDALWQRGYRSGSSLRCIRSLQSRLAKAEISTAVKHTSLRQSGSSLQIYENRWTSAKTWQSIDITNGKDCGNQQNHNRMHDDFAHMEINDSLWRSV